MITLKVKKQELSLLYVSCHLNHIYNPVKQYHDISKAHGLQKQYPKIYKEDVSKNVRLPELSFLHVTCLLNLIYILNKYSIISKRAWKLWTNQGHIYVQIGEIQADHPSKLPDLGNTKQIYISPFPIFFVKT